MSMDKWEEAAGTAALNIGATRCSTETLPTEVVKIRDDIVTAHADLRRTYGKLVRATSLLQQMLNNKHFREMFPESWGILLGAISDPDVIEAMKGEEG